MPPKNNHKRLEGHQQQLAGSKPPLPNATSGAAQPVQANSKRDHLKPCARIRKDVVDDCLAYNDNPSVGGFFRAEKVREIPKSVQRQYTDDVLKTLLSTIRCSDCGCDPTEHNEALTVAVACFRDGTMRSVVEVSEDLIEKGKYYVDRLRAAIKEKETFAGAPTSITVHVRNADGSNGDRAEGELQGNEAFNYTLPQMPTPAAFVSKDYHLVRFNGATEVEQDHGNPPQFTPDGLQAMKDRLIHVMDYRMEVEEKYNTHIPRFVEALRPQVVSRQQYISHIYGESGAGKTWASLDIVEAFYQAKVRFSVRYYFAHSLYDVDLEDPYDADGKCDEVVVERRNVAAFKILVRKLREPSEGITVLIFDECQSRPQLCRAIAGSISNLTQHHHNRTKFYCYFIGLNYVHNANTTFSPPDSVKHQLFPIVPSANGEFATKLLETTSECDHVEDKFRLFCGGNAAATVFVADQLRRVGPSDAVGIAKRAILYLLQRNSVLRLRLSHHAALTTVRLLTAGVVLLTPATEPFLRLGLVTVNESPPIATRRDHSTSSVNEWPQLSRQPTSTDDFALEDDDQQQQQLDREDGCVELDLANKDDEIPISQLVQIPADRRTTQSARTATLTVNPCYLHYYFALLGRQTSVRMNSQRFEEVAMWWVCDRLSAAEYLAARLGRAEVTYKDIFPFAIGSDTLLAERVPRSTEVLPESQSTVGALESRCQELQAGRAQRVSNEQENFCGAIWKGSAGGCCGVMQFKGYERTGFGGEERSAAQTSTLLPFSTIHNEYRKAGFCCCGQQACQCFALSATEMQQFNKTQPNETDTEKRARLDAAIPSCTFGTTTTLKQSFKKVQSATKSLGEDPVFILVTSKVLSQASVDQIKRGALPRCLVIEDGQQFLMPHRQLFLGY